MEHADIPRYYGTAITSVSNFYSTRVRCPDRPTRVPKLVTVVLFVLAIR